MTTIRKRFSGARLMVAVLHLVALFGAPPDARAEDNRFSRSPQSMLAAASAFKETGEHTLETAVIMSEWATARELLSKFPEDEQAKLFNSIVDGLAPSASDPSGSVAPTVFVRDVFELARLRNALAREQIQGLGAILKAARKQAGFQKQLSDALAGESAHFGDDNDTKRLQAYLLLESAGLADLAYEYLPSVEAAKQSRNMDILRIHLKRLSHRGATTENTRELREAMSLGMWLLENTPSPEVDPQQRFRETTRFLLMLPEETGNQWVEEFAAQHPALAIDYLLEVGGQAADKVKAPTPETLRYLQIQRSLAEAVIATQDEITPAVADALTATALSWALVVNQNVLSPKPTGRTTPANRTRFTPAQISTAAPSDAWIMLLKPDTANQLFVTRGKVDAKAQNLDRLTSSIKALSRTMPEVALELSNDFLASWRLFLGTQVQVAPPRTHIWSPSWAGGATHLDQFGVAVTEMSRDANLRLLFATLESFSEVLTDPLDPQAIAMAFADCHGNEQIYAADDMRRLLDLVTTGKPEVARRLVDSTAGRLERRWREFEPDPEKDIHQATLGMFNEVRGTYEALDDLITQALEEDGEDWMLWATLGSARLSCADFHIAQHGAIEPADNDGESVLLAYKQMRDAALEALGHATEKYSAAVAAMNRVDFTPLVYQRRFEAIIKLAEEAKAVLPTGTRNRELEALRSDLLKIDGDKAGEHITAFAKWVDAAEKENEAIRKFDYVDAAMTVLGAEHMPERLNKLLVSWEDVMEEIEFHAELDGSSLVGEGQDFGVFLVLRHTKTVGDSNGSFAEYLANKHLAEGLRRNVERAVRRSFLVKDMKFHDADVKAYGYGKEGWQETPLAYLVLEVRDASIDHVPMLKFDLRYPPLKQYHVKPPPTRLDNPEERVPDVVLPIYSGVIPIDARQHQPRPCTDVIVTQIFDDRARAKDRILLEVQAEGRGLLPEIDGLIELGGDRPIPGFNVVRVIERGTEIAEVDSTGSPIAAVCSRTWIVELDVDDLHRDAARTFHFPQAKDGIEVSYQHYQDADLVECGPALELGWIPTDFLRIATYLVLPVLLVVVIIVGVKYARYLAALPSRKAAYKIPDTLEPFSVVALLRRIETDDTVDLGDDQRGELEADIKAVEQSYFAPDRKKQDGIDLKSNVRRWIAVANG